MTINVLCCFSLWKLNTLHVIGSITQWRVTMAEDDSCMKKQTHTAMLELKSQINGLRNTVFFANGDEYTGEWFNNKKHGEVSLFLQCPNHITPLQLKQFETACLCYKGEALKFGRSLAPSIMASGKKASPVVTVPTLCWCQKQRSTPGNTVASGKWAKNT